MTVHKIIIRQKYIDLKNNELSIKILNIMKSKTIFSFIVTSLFLSTLVLNSCKKDDPEPVDPCENVTCLNGGTCVNGACDCADGYSGPSCADQITPIKIRISTIKITDFPQYDGGSSWDFGSGPDIYVELLLGNTTIHEQPTMFENANATQDYTYTPSSLVDLTDATAQYTIRLYDYDSGSDDDFMGGILFYPYSNTNGFPTTINLDAGGDVTFELTVSYVW